MRQYQQCRVCEDRRNYRVDLVRVNDEHDYYEPGIYENDSIHSYEDDHIFTVDSPEGLRRDRIAFSIENKKRSFCYYLKDILMRIFQLGDYSKTFSIRDVGRHSGVSASYFLIKPDMGVLADFCSKNNPDRENVRRRLTKLAPPFFTHYTFNFLPVMNLMYWNESISVSQELCAIYTALVFQPFITYRILYTLMKLMFLSCFRCCSYKV